MVFVFRCAFDIQFLLRPIVGRMGESRSVPLRLGRLTESSAFSRGSLRHQIQTNAVAATFDAVKRATSPVRAHGRLRRSSGHSDGSIIGSRAENMNAGAKAHARVTAGVEGYNLNK